MPDRPPPPTSPPPTSPPPTPPLATLLSQVLVAFTIEFDNQAEQRMVHQTTVGRADAGPTGEGGRTGEGPRGPWLVSLPMWANFLRFVDAGGVPLRDLEGLAAITNLAGLRRWGYITVDEGPDPLVRLARGGRHAQRIWTPLAAEIEGRWRDRFGAAPIDALRGRLEELPGRIGRDLPWYLPVVRDRMFAQAPPLSDRVRDAGRDAGDISVLLARALLAFTLDYEQATRLSLTVSASALRVLDDQDTALRDLPGRAGVSREAVSMSVGLLTRSGLAVTEPAPAGARGQVVRLTPRGLRARQGSQRRLAAVAADWATRFGAGEIDGLAGGLHDLLTPAGDDGSSLMGAALRPSPAAWRAQRPYVSQAQAVAADPPGALAHHPMVLHRGGWPDGS